MNTADIIDGFYAALAARDLDVLRELLSPEIVVTYHGQPEHFPWAGQFVGLGGFDQFVGSLAEHLEIASAERSEPIVDGDRAVVLTEGEWRVKVNDAIVRAGMANVFTVSNGQISRYDIYVDTAAFLTNMP